MEQLVGKPPWLTVQWTSNPVVFSKFESYPKPAPWKEDVNETLFHLKEQIQPFDRSELWDLAKRITNPYERIHTQSSRMNLPPSVCVLTPLSRSFFKMIEILQILNFFQRVQKVPRLRSLHLCEGPGGFIEAFLQKAEENHKPVPVSYAMTLRSTHTMIPGWRRATPFLQRHPNVKLLYGATGTGDIYEKVNQDYLRTTCETQKVHLVTADGGFDFSDDFHAQEKMIFRLLVSSALIALQNLTHSGDFVLKVFDIQSQVTRDFLTILGSCFQEWTLYKPVTSRPCNSEWYFLGKSAVYGRQPVIQLFAYLRDALESGQTFDKLLPENMKEDFLLKLQEERMAKQSLALQEVLSYCQNPEREKLNKGLWQRQVEPCKQWCSLFRVPYVSPTEIPAKV